MWKTRKRQYNKLSGDRDKTVNFVMDKCSKMAHKEYKTSLKLGGKGDPLGIAQEIKIWPCKQVVYTQSRKWHA